jgi:hypothetical protein
LSKFIKVRFGKARKELKKGSILSPVRTVC